MLALTTAASACATLELLAAGEFGGGGVVRQEQVPLDRFLANRFGGVYAAGGRAVPRTHPVASPA